VSGGRPLWLSLGLILEEGLPLKTLRIVLDSIKASAEECGVKIVTGDTINLKGSVTVRGMKKGFSGTMQAISDTTGKAWKNVFIKNNTISINTKNQLTEVDYTGEAEKRMRIYVLLFHQTKGIYS
jgi:hydrogenase maturation factor